MNGAPPFIAVLALQGDFALHARALERLGVAAREVRKPHELEGAQGLILPGGESTTMLRLMDGTGWEMAIRRFHEGGGALFGTCAGLILLARGVDAAGLRSLGLLDVDADRNAYGRQVDSFEASFPWSGDADPVRGVFIRAPRITRVGAGVRILARHEGHPVLVREGRILAGSFHPELTDDVRVHRYFVEDVARPARCEARS